jgi:hypothetical protein
MTRLLLHYPLQKYLKAKSEPRPPSPATLELQDRFPGSSICREDIDYEERWCFHDRETVVHTQGYHQGYFVCANGDHTHPRVEPSFNSPYFVSTRPYTADPDKPTTAEPIKPAVTEATEDASVPTEPEPEPVVSSSKASCKQAVHTKTVNKPWANLSSPYQIRNLASDSPSLRLDIHRVRKDLTRNNRSSKRRPVKLRAYKTVSSIPVPKPCKPSWF